MTWRHVTFTGCCVMMSSLIKSKGWSENSLHPLQSLGSSLLAHPEPLLLVPHPLLGLSTKHGPDPLKTPCLSFLATSGVHVATTQPKSSNTAPSSLCPALFRHIQCLFLNTSPVTSHSVQPPQLLSVCCARVLRGNKDPKRGS